MKRLPYVVVQSRADPLATGTPLKRERPFQLRSDVTYKNRIVTLDICWHKGRYGKSVRLVLNLWPSSTRQQVWTASYRRKEEMLARAYDRRPRSPRSDAGGGALDDI